MTSVLSGAPGDITLEDDGELTVILVVIAMQKLMHTQKNIYEQIINRITMMDVDIK